MEFTAIVDYIETLIFYKLLKISRVTDAMGWEADAEASGCFSPHSEDLCLPETVARWCMRHEAAM